MEVVEPGPDAGDEADGGGADDGEADADTDVMTDPPPEGGPLEPDADNDVTGRPGDSCGCGAGGAAGHGGGLWLLLLGLLVTLARRPLRH